MLGSIRDLFHRRPRLLLGVIAVGAFVGIIAAWAGSAIAGFHKVASDDFQPATVRRVLNTAPAPGEPVRDVKDPSEERLDPAIVAAVRASKNWVPLPVSSPLLPDEMFTSILLIGADASGYLADVMIYVLIPEDGGPPMMVSLPRDLWLPNPCTGGYTRLNANLGGCKGSASGPELLSIAVEDFTGISVDHFARVNFQGFKTVIDRMGGVTVCVDAPTRDVKAELEIPAGCSQADGATALGWVRSRSAEQLVGEEWKPIPSSDFTRQRHQQDVLFQLGRKLATYSSVASLGNALSNLASAVRLDDGWSIVDIAALAFRYRNLTEDEIVRLKIPTSDYITSGGAYVLRPTERFNDVLAEVYPAAAR